MLTSTGDTRRAKLAQLPARISECLERNRIEEANHLTTWLVLRPDALRQLLPDLELAFRKGGDLELLVELLWANKDAVLNETFVLGHFMRFCEKLGLYDHFGPLLRAWITSASAPDFTFSEYGHLRTFRNLLSSEQKRDFADAKYRRWSDFRALDFFSALDKFSTFASVSPYIAKFLYEHRRDKSMRFGKWLRGFRSAELFKHIVADEKSISVLEKSRNPPDVARYPQLPDLDGLVDTERTRAVFAGFDLSRGLLLWSLHDAHNIILKKCAAVFLPERFSLGLYSGENRISVGKGANTHVSAFHAVKILREKKVLLMFPDARSETRQTSVLNVLGIPIAFADGAPTIAFESGCATGWVTMARENNRLVPVYEPGPSRKTKESFASFKDRWWSFYIDQVERVFTGDPRSITLWYFWPRVFYSAATGTSPGASDMEE